MTAWARRGIDRLEFEPPPAALAPHHQEPLSDRPANRVLDDLDSLGQAGDRRQPRGIDVVFTGIGSGLLPGRAQRTENLFATQQVRIVVMCRR
jgi:hypothetical protein